MVEKNLQQIQLQKIQEQMREINKTQKEEDLAQKFKALYGKKGNQNFLPIPKRKG
jgi:hypothetical protein